MKNILQLFGWAGIFFVLVLCGCKENNKKDAPLHVISVEFDKSMVINLSDFVDSMDVIPLETTVDNLIGGVGKITYYNGRYYVATANGVGGQTLIVFDTSGRYLMKIDNRGQGPGEYHQLTDYAVTKNSEIIIFSSREKIIKYDSLGNLIYERKCEYLMSKIAKNVDDNILVLNKLPLKGDDRDLLTMKDTSLNIENSFFPVTDYELRRMNGLQNYNNFSVHDNNIYFNYPFCDTIFNITSGKRNAAYYMDFGKKKLPPDLFGDEMGIIPKSKMIKKNGGVDAIRGFNVTKNYLYICFSDFENTDYFSLYNLKTNKQLTASTIADDTYFKGFLYNLKECWVPRSYDGEDLLWSLEPQILIQAYEGYKQRASKEEWDKFVSSNAKLVSVCSNLKEEDNPVIMRLKLKK